MKNDTIPAAKNDNHADLPPDAVPEIIGDPNEALMSETDAEVDPAYAGDYELIHGNVRIPGPVVTTPPSFEGGPVQTHRSIGKVYTVGAKLRLSAIDGHHFLAAGVVKRIDGKKPDAVEKKPVPWEGAFRMPDPMSLLTGEPTKPAA